MEEEYLTIRKEAKKAEGYEIWWEDGTTCVSLPSYLRGHHTKNVQAWVEKHTAQIRLIFLPPYAPDHNPDEYLNQDFKNLKELEGEYENVRGSITNKI